MKVKISNIQWDTDGENPETLNLPLEITANFCFDSDEDLTDFISNWLSDNYGFCHFGFTFEVVK